MLGQIARGVRPGELGTERRTEAAQPLALYYSYMNLLKTYCLTRGARSTFDQV